MMTRGQGWSVTHHITFPAPHLVCCISHSSPTSEQHVFYLSSFSLDSSRANTRCEKTAPARQAPRAADGTLFTVSPLTGKLHYAGPHERIPKGEGRACMHSFIHSFFVSRVFTSLRSTRRLEAPTDVMVRVWLLRLKVKR